MDHIHDKYNTEISHVKPGSLFKVADSRFQGDVATIVNGMGAMIRDLNDKWWRDPVTKLPIKRNFGEMIALAHSELSEALEGHRKNLQDDHLPKRKMVEVELADAIIRILDLGTGMGLDVGGAMQEKLQYNISRADHKLESRLKPGGKAY